MSASDAVIGQYMAGKRHRRIIELMASRTRAADEARRAWERNARELGDELRAGRHVLGVTQAEIGAALGISGQEVCRRELGRTRRMTGSQLAVHAAAVGLKLVVKLYPLGGGSATPRRHATSPPSSRASGRPWRVTLEAPVPIAGDLRAVDVLLASERARIAVEVITQAGRPPGTGASSQLKARDIGATRLILVIAGDPRQPQCPRLCASDACARL